MASCVKALRNGLAIFCAKRLAVVTRVISEVGQQDGTTRSLVKTVPVPDSPGITCMETSPSGALFGVCTDDKKLYVWKTDSMDVLLQRSVAKRAVALSFVNTEEEILVADKAGDVWSFHLKNLESESKLLLGHVSMLLDMVVTGDDRFVITCDRDEKIRVSHFPNSYNIHCFCLGHTELVSKLCLCSSEKNWLVSGSADGSVILWDYTTGDVLDQVIFDGNPVITGLAFSSETRILVVSNENSSHLFCYRLADKGKLVEYCKYDTNSEICHFEYNPDNYLWVLLGCDRNPLLCLKWTSDTFVRDESQFGQEVLAAVRDAEVLKDIQTTIPNYSELKKREYDNVAQYLQRKEERAKQPADPEQH
jgi:tRNA (guanine-N(7)-)-methyltransferase subunit TRM82